MKLRRVLLGLGFGLGGSAALVSCRSLSKDDMETTLLALPKNAGFREAGLQHTRMSIPLDGQMTDVEVTWVKVARKEPLAGGLPPQPIVLVHGTPGSLFTWSDAVCGTGSEPGLAQQHDVYAIDILGHGMTRTEDRPVTFQKCADELHP